MRSAPLACGSGQLQPPASAARSSAACRGTGGRGGAAGLMVGLVVHRFSSCPALCRASAPLYTAVRTRCGMPSFMDMALDEARKAQDLGEVPVGCVIVRDGAVIAATGNRTLADRDPTAHAEMLAIRAAAATARLRAADRLRPPCHARALRHVRGGDVVCAHPQALLRRARSQGRRGRATACGFSRRRPAITGRRSMAASAKPKSADAAARLLRRRALELGSLPKTGSRFGIMLRLGRTAVLVGAVAAGRIA